jgi:uncharacterized membrane protein
MLAIILLILGIFFRGYDLGDRPYWVDEVATSMRVAGYTKQQVMEQLADGHVRPIADLQRYQQLDPSKDWSDTWAALVRSPEHAPLYFLLARLWSQIFGSSVVAMRSLSVWLSLLALPGIAALSRELFVVNTEKERSGNGSPIEWLAVSLLSISPFFVAYAQEARPYSLWIVLLLGMHWTLLRAMRQNDRLHWLAYGVSVTLGLYTSLLSGLVLLGQSLYVAALQRWRLTRILRHYSLTLGMAIGAFMPWVVIVVQQWATLQDNTTWTRGSLGLGPMLAIWLYNIAVLYFDVPIVTAPLWIGLLQILVALTIASLIGVAVYYLWRKTAQWQWLFVVSLIATTPACLIAVDVVSGSQISTAARYLLPSHLGIQLAMACVLAHKLAMASAKRRFVWRWILAFVIAISCISCLFQLYQSPKYQKSRNLHNQPIAAILNQAHRPTLIAESSQTLDVISLSYELQPAVQVQILSPFDSLPNLNRCNLFIFNPSESLQDKIQATPEVRLEAQYQPKRLVPKEIALSLWSVKSLAGTTDTNHECSID